MDIILSIRPVPKKFTTREYVALVTNIDSAKIEDAANCHCCGVMVGSGSYIRVRNGDYDISLKYSCCMRYRSISQYVTCAFSSDYKSTIKSLQLCTSSWRHTAAVFFIKIALSADLTYDIIALIAYYQLALRKPDILLY